MNFKKLLILIGLTVATNSEAQQNRIVQLEKEYEQAEGNLKIEKLENLIWLYSDISLDKADSLHKSFVSQLSNELNEFDKAKVTLLGAILKRKRRAYSASIGLAKEVLLAFKKDSSNNSKELFNVYDLLASNKTMLGEYDSADYFFNRSLIIANAMEDNELKRDVYNGLGINYWYKSDYLSANNAYHEALKLSISIGDSVAIGYTNRNIGIVYEMLGEYSKALSNYQVTLEIYQSMNLLNRVHEILNSLGVLYRKIGDFDASLENYSRAYEIRRQLKDTVGMAKSLNNIGNAKINMGDYGKALESLLQAYELQKDREGNVDIQVTLANIGLAYERVYKPVEAKKYYLMSLKEAKRLDDKHEIRRAYQLISKLLLTEGKYDEALNYAKQSLSLSEELNVKTSLSSSNQTLSMIYKAMQEFELALEHYQIHASIENELFNEASTKELNRLRAKYEFDLQKKELANNKQEIENLGKQNAQLETRQLILVLLFLVLFLLIVLLIISNRNRVKRVKLERDLSQERAENTELAKKYLAHEIEINELKLTAYAEQLIQKNEMIAEFEDKVNRYEEKLIEANENKLSGSAILVEGRSGSSLSWDEFRLRFDEVHTGYTQRLVSKHPDLTSNELDVSILLKVNLSYKDISSVLGVSYEGVKKSIQRLYKKLGFENVDLLRAYLIKI